jgi:hypothetical protein
MFVLISKMIRIAVLVSKGKNIFCIMQVSGNALVIYLKGIGEDKNVREKEYFWSRVIRPDTKSDYQFSFFFRLLGLERASLLLCIGSICILVVLIFGIILCRLDMSAGNSKLSFDHYFNRSIILERRSVRQYIEN